METVAVKEVVNPFESIEKEILSKNPSPIRLERLLKKRPDGETLIDFLVKFFTIWNSNRNTIFVDDLSIQTEIDKRRSLGDIYLICKYYYPDCTLNDVIKALYVKLRGKMPDGFRTSYCTTILKRVWYFNPNDYSGIYNKEHKDEFGNTYNFYLENVK